MSSSSITPVTPEAKRARLNAALMANAATTPSPLATPDRRGSGAAATAETPNSKAMLSIPHSPCLQKLGYGTGVNVFLYRRPPALSGSCQDGTPSPWAIKKLRGEGKAKKASGSPKSELAVRLEREAEILKSLSHPNIIGYRGFRRSSDGSRLLAVENGEKSLLDMIEELNEADGEDDEESFPFAADDILTVVSAVADALSYLHREKGILHGDIKAANVLVKGDFEQVKLCDFGVSLKLDENMKVSKEEKSIYVGTGPFAPPEALEGAEEEGDGFEICDRSDVFSLGCVIYEMLALEAPHVNILTADDADPDDSVSSEAESLYAAALGTRPSLPDRLEWLADDEEYQKVLSIFYACTESRPDKRPSAADIVRLVKEDGLEDKK